MKSHMRKSLREFLVPTDPQSHTPIKQQLEWSPHFAGDQVEHIFQLYHVNSSGFLNIFLIIFTNIIRRRLLGIWLLNSEKIGGKPETDASDERRRSARVAQSRTGRRRPSTQQRRDYEKHIDAIAPSYHLNFTFSPFSSCSFPTIIIVLLSFHF